MDKMKIKNRIKTALIFFGQSILGAGLCFFGIYLSIFAAKNGSSFLYYAMAFASPGTAMEILHTPPSSEPPPLSTDAEQEENAGAQTGQDEVLPEQLPQKEEAVAVPEVPESRRGKVTETKYSAGEGGRYVAFGNAIIKNCTGHSSAKIKSMLKTKHALFLSTENKLPQVLVYHTHATEGFEPADRGYFDTAGTWRSTDNTQNMVSVGRVFKETLAEKGINTVQDTTLHDDPSYNGAYKRSAKTVTEHMEQSPSLSVFVDLHRDAIEPSQKEIIKPTAVINGKKAAQIMIIAGCDDGTMNMPNYWDNLRFAAALASKMEELYPGLCRPVLFDYRRYNMDLSTGLLLIEIGATGNTLEEAQYSAELLANAMAALFTE